MKFETSEEICKMCVLAKTILKFLETFPKNSCLASQMQLITITNVDSNFLRKVLAKFQYGIWNCYFVNLMMAQTPIRKFFGSSTELCLGELLFYFPTSTLNV